MAEIVTIETWLYLKLAGNLAGVANRVYSDVAPLNATFPCIVFQMQSALDGNNLNGSRILGNQLWLVKVIGQVTGDVALQTIANSIDSQIHKKTGTGVLSCVRESPFKMTEEVDGLQYRHLGGIYRIYVQ